MMRSQTHIIARYAETDQMGIIHHSVYPVWYEAARTEYIKMAGITYTQLEQQGVMLPLTELTCRYLRPVHYEDEVVIETETIRLTYSRITFCYRVMLDGVLMAEGTTTHGFVSSKTFRPVNLKKLMPDFYARLQESAAKDEQDA